MTPRGIAQLINDEGEILHDYPDSEGYLTIGIGHLIDRRKGGGISQRISRLIFEDDIREATIDLQKLDWFRALDPVRQDVIVMLCFNMGLGSWEQRTGLLGFHRMIEALKRQDWHQAAFELSNSQWKNQVGKARHDALTDALQTGKWT